MQLPQSSPRYWPGVQGNFILEEGGGHDILLSGFSHMDLIQRLKAYDWS